MSRLRAQLAPARPAHATPQQKNKLQGVVVRKRKASEIEGDRDNDDKPNAPKINGVIKTPPRTVISNRIEITNKTKSKTESQDQKRSRLKTEPRDLNSGQDKNHNLLGSKMGLKSKVGPCDSAADDEQVGVLRCIGVLPGLGHYNTDSTSNSDDSSDSEDDDKSTSFRDLVARRTEEQEPGNTRKTENAS
ncbi:hypothetical protein EVAR_80721_1 [Eumeta japonica]|uniref:Uncharacterized protein n=1 Tax=Eumeta variegata TaxID=151549 RepID=A0A4C1U3L0_EUMVA|nr:hypothetical protein EVAR_80721_1 [Eumeta japonica]